jgi:hypothetical protein
LATFHGDASFSGATFNGEALGPVAVRDVLDLDAAVFEQKVTVEAAASRVLARRANFTGATLRLDFAEVCLDHVTSSEALTVIPASREVSAWGIRPARSEKVSASHPPELTLLSLSGVDASQLLLVDVRESDPTSPFRRAHTAGDGCSPRPDGSCSPRNETGAPGAASPGHHGSMPLRHLTLNES